MNDALQIRDVIKKLLWLVLLTCASRSSGHLPVHDPLRRLRGDHSCSRLHQEETRTDQLARSTRMKQCG
jgi:hypothetical protein